jgi:hypothetical protein
MDLIFIFARRLKGLSMAMASGTPFFQILSIDAIPRTVIIYRDPDYP